MSTRTTVWEPGTPCWVDLMTPDPMAANAFYAALFGWQVTDTGPELGHYGIAVRGGLATAGIGPTQPGTAAPAAWTTYLATADVDKTTELITSNGGFVVSGPHTVPGQGRMLVAQDPTGAVFGAWQADGMIGAQLVNEPGGLTWNDCHSTDPATARAFYAAVFGFRYTPMEGPFDYTTIDGAGPGSAIGGIGEPDPTLPGAPSHWTVYFSVPDADTAIATAIALGGAVQTAATDTPFGRMATIRDPQGALFKVMGTVGGSAASQEQPR